GQEIDHAGSPRLPGGRQEVQIPAAAFAQSVQYDPRTIARKMGIAGGLPDGGAELRGGALSARQADGSRPATPTPLEIIAAYREPSGPRQRGAGVGPDAVDHRSEPIRPLWRQMLTQAHSLKQRDCIGRQNVSCRLTRIDGEQECDQPAHEVGVAVAAEGQNGAGSPVWTH